MLIKIKQINCWFPGRRGKLFEGAMVHHQRWGNGSFCLVLWSGEWKCLL